MIIIKKLSNTFKYILIVLKNRDKILINSIYIYLTYNLYKNYCKFKILLKNLVILKFLRIKKKDKQSGLKIKVLKDLDKWSKNQKNKSSSSKTVLVDCMWDNPNYWLRYAFLRKAINLGDHTEYGVFNENSSNLKEDIINSFNFKSLGSPINDSKPGLNVIMKASLLMKDVKNNSDLLKINLPYNFPISNLYDDILKKQQRATVNIKDKKIIYYLAQVLCFLEQINKLFEKYKFDIVVLSHGMGFTFASIAWLALERKIPVYILYGDFSTKRFFFLENQNELFSYPSRVTKLEIDSISKVYRDYLTQKGYSLIKDRFSGRAQDISTNFAYNRSFKNINKKEICSLYNWDIEKPIIIIYSCVWFDFPHASGLKLFDDFFDWIKSTLIVASKNKKVNWLIKPHPLEEYFPQIKGPNLNNLVKSLNQNHLKIIKKGWDSNQLIKVVDGIITCHGTIGLEAGILGIPVLVPYDGYYGHLSFVNSSNNKEDYFKNINSNWYLNKPDQKSKDMAALFSSIYYGRPKWQKYLYSPDDHQDKIYNDIQSMFSTELDTINNEILNLKSWIISKHKYYQIFKMLYGK